MAIHVIKTPSYFYLLHIMSMNVHEFFINFFINYFCSPTYNFQFSIFNLKSLKNSVISRRHSSSRMPPVTFALGCRACGAKRW